MAGLHLRCLLGCRILGSDPILGQDSVRVLGSCNLACLIDALWSYDVGHACEARLLPDRIDDESLRIEHFGVDLERCLRAVCACPAKKLGLVRSHAFK